MKLLVKRFLFCLIIISGVLATLIFKTPLHTESNLMSLLANNSEQQWPIDKISNKFSSVINIVIESNDDKSATKSANNIIQMLNSDAFDTLNVQSGKFSLKSIISDFVPYKNNLLSVQHKNLLQQKEYKQIANSAIKYISESMMPPIVSLSQDPFMLLSDYVMNINVGDNTWTLHNGLLWQNIDGTHYFMIPIDVNIANTTRAANQINLLSAELTKQNSETIKTHLSGIPLHTAFMVQRSQIQLGILSFLSVMMAILFNYLLFRKLFTLIPVLTSLLVGFIGGTIALFLCFSTPHILTFVFGTTLIGLGIDYSFHFMTAATLKDKKQIYMNMRQSFLTTLVCFLPLMFSGISLLEQISVFTITGLTIIYIGLNLFIPNKLNLKIKPIRNKLSLSKKTRVAILSAILIAIMTTLPFAKMENNMNQLYRPNAQIAEQDAFFQKLNNTTNSNILLVRGYNMEQVLETEEEIKSNTSNFFSISSVIPSTKTQSENQELIKQLYTHQAKYLKRKLELRNLPTFVENDFITPNNIKSEFLTNWLNKMIINDNGYIYSVAQIPTDITVQNENAVIVNPSQILTHQIEKFSATTYRLLLICGLCLIALLTVFYKKRAIIYLIPSMLAILLSISVLTWFGCPITFFHMLAFFIVIGLGIDYTIFNINADNDKEMRPVLFSFLTSFVGFGMLAFTSFFLIKTMGITLGLGLALSYLISLFLFRTK